MRANGKERSVGKHLGGGVGEGRGEGEAERQHGGDTSVAVLTFSPLEPGSQQKPPGPDSTQTPELRRRNKGCFPPSSLFHSATVSSFRNEHKTSESSPGPQRLSCRRREASRLARGHRWTPLLSEHRPVRTKRKTTFAPGSRLWSVGDITLYR